MSDERIDEGVGRVGDGATPLPVAPLPRPEVSTARPPKPEGPVARSPAGPTSAARPAVVRSALGHTVAQFVVDPTTYEVRVRLIDPETRTVVREIPPGDLVELARSAATYQGFLVDRSV